MKKLLYLVLIFTFFFNGTIVNNTSRQVIQDVDEPIFKIEPARVDQETLRISWLVEGLESLESGDLEALDSVVLSVRELNADGFLNDPQEFIFYTLNGQKDFSWDGTTALSIRLIVKSVEYSQYSGPDCESMFCYREITKQITSEEYLIDALPEVPVVQIPDELEPEVIGVVEGSTPGELAELLDKDVDDILVDLLGLNILKSEDDVLSDNEIEVLFEKYNYLPAFISKVDTSTNITFTNELITTIPVFSDIDFSDQAKNTFAFLITSLIIFLFYGVLLAQEWFNRIISHYRVKWTNRKQQLKEKTRLEIFMEISLVALLTSLLYAFVEEGFTFEVRDENLAIFLGVLIGLIVVTFFYEGIESLIEYYVHDQIVKFDWNPQAMFFAILSTVLFIVIDLPFGFILGFIASIHIVSKREKAELSPKFYSMISLSIVGYMFFYATSFESVSTSGFLMAICKLSYLMCLEGVIFKAVPWGGNELFDAIGDSEGVNQAMPVVSFLISIWLFIRILVLPPDSEFNALQESLLASGALAYRFMLILLVYIFIILLLGNFMKKYAELNKPAEYEESLIENEIDISELYEDELTESSNEW